MSVTPARRPITATSPLLRVPEWLRRSPRERAADRLRGVGPGLDRLPGRRRAPACPSSTAGRRRRRRRRSPDGRARSGPARPGSGRCDRCGASVAAATASAERRREDAGGPEDRSGRDSAPVTPSGRLDRDRALVEIDHAGLRPDRHAEPLELAGRGGRAIRRVGLQDAVRGLDEEDPRLGRVDRVGSRAGACRGRSRRVRRRARLRSARHPRSRTSSTRRGAPDRARARQPRTRSGSSAASRVASSRDFSPGAIRAQSSWPK